MRRRLYLMRHGAVAYFAPEGRPLREDDVPLTPEGRAQAEAARALLAEVELDRVVASSLPRALETAELVAPEREIEIVPAFRELKGAALSSIPSAELEEAFVRAFHGGVVPNEKRFLGGETIGELFDRVLPALAALVDDASWDTALVVAHGAVNRAILSYALTGERIFLGRFEQAPGCVNVIDVAEDDSDWIVRAVNISPVDLVHRATRLTQMEEYWAEMVREGGEPPART